MGKKNKVDNLGHALIKSRFGGNKLKPSNSDGHLRHVDLQEEHDWGTDNFQSVVEENSFEKFFAIAKLGQATFEAEKFNIEVVDTKNRVVSNKQKEETLKFYEDNKSLLKIPRRPKWYRLMTAQELQTKEQTEFLKWRQKLATLEEENCIITPYEKNLEFWREFWRVIDRSDIIVEIVDARNPLLFQCEDLEQYIKEVDSNKIHMILINKADYLTEEQRKIWAEYFSKINVRVVFFSALLAAEQISSQESNKECGQQDQDKNINNSNSDIQEKTECSQPDDSLASKEPDTKVCLDKVSNSSDLYSPEKLIALFKSINQQNTYCKDVLTVGLVGYPNVGKSSTINALLMNKKVAVSKTPGKTKHYQTLYIDKNLMLCDSPGMIMPSFASSKAEMVLHGILPINHLRDHVSPINLLSTLVPRNVIENLYGIMIPKPTQEEDSDRPPTAEEILNAHGYNRGFMTQNGQPDNSRSARAILKDFVIGKLLYCTGPPDYDQAKFHTFTLAKQQMSTKKVLPEVQVKVQKNKNAPKDIDDEFFQSSGNGIHIKGRSNIPFRSISDNSSVTGMSSDGSCIEKPWKKINKHANKNKREKSRRVYAYLDKH